MDDVTYMRVKFYVDGSKRKGTVHVDLKKVNWFVQQCGYENNEFMHVKISSLVTNYLCRKLVIPSY